MRHQRATKQLDIIELGETVDNMIDIFKTNQWLTLVRYGKADYGYFVQIELSKSTDCTQSIIVKTKAGARHFANHISKSLSIPIISDWDEN